MISSILRKFKSKHRKYVLMLVDLGSISACYIVAWLTLMRRIPLGNYVDMMLVSWVCFIAAFFIMFWLFGMYESLWRYAEAHEFFKCMLATISATAIFIAGTWFWMRPPHFSIRIPITVYFLGAMMAGMSTLLLRIGYRAYRATIIGARTAHAAKKVMIVGAGNTGNAVLQELCHDQSNRYEVICAVDDDYDKQGRSIQRVKIAGTTKSIPQLVSKYGIDVIILAIPNASNKDYRRVTNICAKTKCQIKKVPDLYSFVVDSASIVSQIRDVSVDDLLGRESVDMIYRSPSFFAGKTVLVTGAGGSIGSELCRQIAVHELQRLVLLDISEGGLYGIQQELLRKYGDKINLCAEVASVRDENKMELLFSRYKPDIVYHAAAHKHVPLMESAPEEAVKNNIFGTLNVARCADRHKTGRFILISSDKAVNPTNVMGATKRCCEMIVQCMDQSSKTEFVAVRFGNVLGSSGSAVPLFKDQIAAGGPVTVTHPDIIRYFMTISEAVSLVLTAGEMARGGEIFVLDMGEPVKILELAESLIRISGYEPYKDIDIAFTGLRPGEKLYEELLMDEEGIKKTKNQKIFIGRSIDISRPVLFDALDKLKAVAEANRSESVVEALHKLIPSFKEQEAAPVPEQEGAGL